MKRLLVAMTMIAIVGCGASPSVVRTVEARDAGVNAPGVAASSPSVSGAAASGNPGVSGSGPAAATAPGAATPTATPSGTVAPTASGGTGAAATSPSAQAAPVASCSGSANGGSTDTGVSATSIKIGGTFFNGGYLDKYSQVTENAAKAYFDYVNDQGGICGRKIDFLPCDTAGTADGTTGCLTTLGDQDKVFIMGPSLDFNLDIVQPYLASHKLPWVGDSGLYQAEFQSPWMFPTQQPGSAVGTLIATYSIQNLHVKKIGISYLNDVAGPACTANVQHVAQHFNVPASATASNGEIETALDSQVSTLRNAGVDSVLFCNDPVNTIKFIQAAQRAGWHPTFVGGFVAAADVPLAAGSYAAGMYGFTGYDFYDSNTTGVSQYRQITQYYYPNTFHHFYEQAAYVGAEAVVAALRATGANLTRTNFLNALKSMTDFDSGMGLHLNFANLANAVPTGLMLQADSSLAWHVISGRFGPAG